MVDGPGALDELPHRFRDPVLRELAREMIVNGYTVMRNLPTARLCDEAVADYLEFCEATGAEHRHAKARINNLHMYSTVACILGLDPVLMRFLDGPFGKEAVPYTSLTFQYGAEQKAYTATGLTATPCFSGSTSACGQR